MMVMFGVDVCAFSLILQMHHTNSLPPNKIVTFSHTVRSGCFYFDGACFWCGDYEHSLYWKRFFKISLFTILMAFNWEAKLREMSWNVLSLSLCHPTSNGREWRECYCRQSFRRQPQSSNWPRWKRCESEKELNRERKCVWAGNTHTGVSVLPGESSHIILELILFGILKISKVRLCGGGIRFFPNEHIPCLSRRVLGLSSPTFWVCIWLSRQQLIIIKQVGVLEQWRRGGRGSGIPHDQLPILASRYFAWFHDKAGGGGQKGTYVCGGE